jgi:hypothetical protein
MLTGVWGDKHGVNDPGNSFAGNQFATYPSFFKHLETANSNLNTLAFARWAPMLTAVPNADVGLAFASDAAVTDETCRRLTNSNPDVMWMLLLDVDSAGHASGWGPTVSNYVRAIEIADGRVGQILRALTSRPSYTNEDWLVIVQTDQFALPVAKARAVRCVPEALAHIGLVHHAKDRSAPAGKANQRPPGRHADNERLGAVYRIEHPAMRVFARLVRKFLACNAVRRVFGFYHAAHCRFGPAIGFRYRIEAACLLVGHISACAKMGQNHFAGFIRQTVRKFGEGSYCGGF